MPTYTFTHMLLEKDYRRVRTRYLQYMHSQGYYMPRSIHTWVRRDGLALDLRSSGTASGSSNVSFLWMLVYLQMVV